MLYSYPVTMILMYFNKQDVKETMFTSALSNYISWDAEKCRAFKRSNVCNKLLKWSWNYDFRYKDSPFLLLEANGYYQTISIIYCIFFPGFRWIPARHICKKTMVQSTILFLIIIRWYYRCYLAWTVIITIGDSNGRNNKNDSLASSYYSIRNWDVLIWSLCCIQLGCITTIFRILLIFVQFYKIASSFS